MSFNSTWIGLLLVATIFTSRWTQPWRLLNVLSLIHLSFLFCFKFILYIYIYIYISDISILTFSSFPCFLVLSYTHVIITYSFYISLCTLCCIRGKYQVVQFSDSFLFAKIYLSFFFTPKWSTHLSKRKLKYIIENHTFLIWIFILVLFLFVCYFSL